jgi:hypothetical protein
LGPGGGQSRPGAAPSPGRAGVGLPRGRGRLGAARCWTTAWGGEVSSAAKQKKPNRSQSVDYATRGEIEVSVLVQNF